MAVLFLNAFSIFVGCATKLFCNALSKSTAPCVLSKAGTLSANFDSIAFLMISAFDFMRGALGSWGGGIWIIWAWVGIRGFLLYPNFAIFVMRDNIA